MIIKIGKSGICYYLNVVPANSLDLIAKYQNFSTLIQSLVTNVDHVISLFSDPEVRTLNTTCLCYFFYFFSKNDIFFC